MKVVEASYDIIPEQENPLKKVERIARICYKSEEKIEDDSYVKMITDLCQRRHYAMLEHASIVLECDEAFYSDIDMKNDMLKKMYGFTSFLRFSITGDEHFFISGNLRAWLEFCVACRDCLKKGLNKELYDILMTADYRVAFGQIATGDLYTAGHCYTITSEMLNVLPQNIRFIHQDLSVHFVTDRGVSHEMVRHRPCSFAQESTRFCNYGLGKYGKEITVLKPLFWKEGSDKYREWYDAAQRAESAYFELLADGGKPQEARAVLPTSLKTEIVITANLQEWHHILNLRACDATGPAHPQMKQVMLPLLKDLLRDENMHDIFSDLWHA